ncbi:Ff.00g039010.m01.CDS01 [Fusarium sp. VM40]|nr:Ff.00g039010.m01.CDS01 [Fusarium sp. VM40]
MIIYTLLLASLAANVAAGPCRPGVISSSVGTTTSNAAITTLAAATSIEATTTSTDTSPTTTSTSELPRDEIIFEINPVTRLLAKRDTRFLGSNNPSECTFASVFRLNYNQLLENGVPIYYAGQGYQELAADGEPPVDGITTTFSVVDGKLSWTNDEFGEAGFCQDGSDGKVYITFGSTPPDCESVTLTAYKATQCQNGEIVGLEITSALTTDAADHTTSTVEATTSAAVTTSADVCAKGIDGLEGNPPRESRLSDCSALYTVTVSPYPVTSTVVKRELAIRIPTGRYTGQPVINTLFARAEGEPTATTIQPTEVPTYATYCDSPSDYYEACSEAGITGFTTTLPTPTSTDETTVTDCPMRRMAKRAGEAVGYKYEENWDAYNMPGYRLF